MQLEYERRQKSQQRSRNSAKTLTSLAATNRRVSMTDSTSLMSKLAETPFSGNNKSPPGSWSLQNKDLLTNKQKKKTNQVTLLQNTNLVILVMRINLERSNCTTTIKIKRRFSWKGSSQIQTDYTIMMNKEPKQSLKNNEINDRPAKTHEQHSVISASTVILDILYIHLVQLINILTAVFSFLKQSQLTVLDNYFPVELRL